MQMCRWPTENQTLGIWSETRHGPFHQWLCLSGGEVQNQQDHRTDHAKQLN